MCVLIFCTILSETFLILRIQQGIFIKVYRSSCKVRVILVRFQSDLNFLVIVSKKAHIIFHENLSSRCLVVPYGRTYRHEANSRFPHFENAPESMY